MPELLLLFMRKMRIASTVWQRGVLSLAVLVLSCGISWAADKSEKFKDDLTEMSLEDLMELNVSSVSRKDQKLASAAAAVYVITQDDIRHSGATNIPDLLRMVPGVQVAKIDSNKWAVSIRGFNGRFANKLLVLMDGRTIYTPFFSGVYWEMQDTPLEDIERIEVIRGPGAALWGANAVNGVISIITKHAVDTNGGLISAGAGISEKGFVTARYGTQVSENSDLRIYAKHNDRGPGEDGAGNKVHDSWYLSRAGFRYDAKPLPSDTLTVQGDYFYDLLNENYTFYKLPTLADPRYSWNEDRAGKSTGGNIQSRWQKVFSVDHSISTQLFYEHTDRQLAIIGEKRDTVDLDFQHRFPLMSFQDVVWGVGYRYTHDSINPTQFMTFRELEKGTSLYTAFLHDEITIVPKQLSLIIGTRIEHNDYTGVEFLPNGRLLWTPNEKNSIWGAVSRAVRTPSRADSDIDYRHRTFQPNSPDLPVPLPPPLNALPARSETFGNPDLKSETVISYELGYRTAPVANTTMDVALFYNEYDQLRTLELGAPQIEYVGMIPSNVYGPLYLTNKMHGHTYGIELAVGLSPFDWWRLHGTYSYLKSTLYLDAASIYGYQYQFDKKNAQDGSPRHQASVRSGFDITRQLSFDIWLRYADRIESIGGSSIPSYVTMDARLAWKLVKNIELALVGQNLFHDRQQEFIPDLINTTPSGVPRGFYGKMTWKF